MSEPEKPYTVHDEPGFARVYDEDDPVTIRRGDLRALLDVATGSLDFGSGFLCNEEVEVMRAMATVLGIDPHVVTPPNFECLYSGEHDWKTQIQGGRWCWRCNRSEAGSDS